MNRMRSITLSCMGTPLLLLAGVVWYLPKGISLPTSPVDFWTLVAAVAAVLMLSVTIGVGFVAWFGLRSLRLARQDMVTRATREARSISMLRAEEFSRMLKGEHRAIQEELVKAKIARFTAGMQSGERVFDDPAVYQRAKPWWESVPPELRGRIIFLLNDLEAWAMYFTKELADSEMVFGPIAPTFCSMALQYSPWIVVVRKESFAGFYPNLITLFHAWRAELDSLDRGSKIEAALRAASVASARLEQYRIPSPLGTKVDI